MSYVKAADVMPQELIEKIQEYVNGTYIYIPRKEAEKKSWGEATSTRQELTGRNQQIYNEHKSGQPTRELADRYCLSVKSIQKIIRTEVKRLSEPVPAEAAACVWEIVPQTLPKIIRSCPKCGPGRLERCYLLHLWPHPAS